MILPGSAEHPDVTVKWAKAAQTGSAQVRLPASGEWGSHLRPASKATSFFTTSLKYSEWYEKNK